MEIRILPGNVANMIAAGEVVQRPASVVKELMENALDAGADRVDVSVTDAGRTLIQVIDNGCGMSPAEAELCFERHATSKIATAEDLSAIRTFGFRGEALASIAAVAEVTLKTRREEDETGCRVEFAASSHLLTEETAAPKGSNFAVRNLFYNVPARRKFLKSDNIEFKHIVEEFTRIVLTRPEMAFSLTHNGREIYVLKPAKSLKFRIQDVLGASVAESLVDVGTKTSIVRISGFTGRPDLARKAVGNQFFFLNGRYFRSPYFHRAVMKAYEQLIPEGVTPAYCLYLETDPHAVDVNIHPTKAEIKFEDDTLIFNTLYAAVREVIGRNSFIASIDFDNAGVPDLPVFGPAYAERHSDGGAPAVNVDGAYNPFDRPDSGYRPHFDGIQAEAEVPGDKSRSAAGGSQGPFPGYGGIEKREDYGKLFEDKTLPSSRVIVLQDRLILTPVKSGLMAVHIKRARERILYERFLEALSKDGHVSQTALFPVHVRVGVQAVPVFTEHAEMLSRLGFDIAPFGPDTVIVNGVPEGYGATPGTVESLVGDLLLILSEDYASVPGRMASALAEKFAILGATGGEAPRSPYEAQQLVDALFACENAETTPSGRHIVAILSVDDLLKKF